MDEEISIINTNVKNQRIKDFFVKNKNKLLAIIVIITILIISYLSFDEINKRNKIKLSNQYNLALIDYTSGKKIEAYEELVLIINKKDATYSPLALYFLIDNNLIEDKEQVNNLFNLLINKTNLKNEIKNLVIYKKALFNSNFLDENELISILKPIISSQSIWESHALYLMAEYFYAKNQKQKSKEFFEKIIILKNSNPEIKIETQKRLNRDFSE